MAAILDRQNGRRYGQAQFINEIVDFIRSDEGREPCYRLLEGLETMREGGEAAVVSVTLPQADGVPPYLAGTTYDLVQGESDLERHEREWIDGSQPPAAEYLRPAEAARLLRVDPRTVNRWAAEGKLRGFRTPGGHWRVSVDSVRALEGLSGT